MTDYGPSVPHTVAQSDEYQTLAVALEDYLDSEQGGEADVWRALAALLGSSARERFQEYWGVDDAAETACIRRVITGEPECRCSSTRSWVDRELESVGDRDEPPHTPPHSDHAMLWLDDGEPVLYAMHVYNPEIQVVSKTAAPDGDQRRNGWFDFVAFAEEWGLEIGITPWSWYNLFRTVNVVFYAPEMLRTGE